MNNSNNSNRLDTDESEWTNNNNSRDHFRE